MKLSRFQRGGFALVLTLSIVVLLTVLALAYLFTSSLEQSTARAAANRVRAELAAQAAVSMAMTTLTESFRSSPDSATGWTTVNGNVGTVLYYRDAPAGGAATPPPLHVQPLFSGATRQLATEKDSSLADVLTDANSFNFNHPRFAGDTQGWIGSPPGSTGTPPPHRGQWIDMLDAQSKVAARYAFWVEDESFKANVNFMGATPRGNDSLGNDPNQIPLQGWLKNVVQSGSADAVATDILNYRNGFRDSRFFEFPAINHVQNQSNLSEQARYTGTIYSSALNMSRRGAKRVNINKLVTTTNDPSTIRTELDAIIGTIRHELPNFGQRFYRLNGDFNSITGANSPPQDRQTIYLNKLAANIRDYIDTDSQPTVVNNDAGYSINIGAAPAHAFVAQGGGTSGANEVIAIGKERVPFLQEYLLRVKQLVFSTRLGPSAQYKIEIDHYLEFWNMSNRDIAVSDLGPNPFLRIANQFGWEATQAGGAAGTDIPEGAPRDFSVPLASFRDENGNELVFRAGVPTVLTTDAEPLPAVFNATATRIFRPAPGTISDQFRVYQGTTTRKSGSNLRLSSKMRPTATGSDAETELLLGNDLGVLESFAAPFIPNISVNVDDDTTTPTGQNSQKFDTSKWHFRGSSLQGNSGLVSPGQKGDPRTNWEQLALSSTITNDRTRYLQVLASSNTPDSASLTALNTEFVNPTLWVDPAMNVTDATHAPAVIANVPMTSIGELGHIFDPARSLGTSGDVRYSRGGGRTLKVGQPDRFDSADNPGGLWDGNSDSASRDWTAWRLTDVFSTTDDLQLPARININGIARDDGAAFRAALHGYAFHPTPQSGPHIASQQLSDSAIDALVTQAKDRLKNTGTFATTAGPFAERGEISELPIFNSGSQLAGASANTSTIYDRGREELFRRVAELITTRGNVFTVYAVGQSLIPKDPNQPKVVTSTSRLRIVFRIDPVWNSPPAPDPVPPSDIAARMAKPDRYAVQVLYAGE
jgi:hypothetical protein